MIIMIFVRCEPEYGEIAGPERIGPLLLACSKDPLVFEEFVLHEQRVGTAKRAGYHARIGGRQDMFRVVRHGAAFPIPYLSLEDAFWRGERIRRSVAFGKVDTRLVCESQRSGKTASHEDTVIKEAEQSRKPAPCQGLEDRRCMLPDARIAETHNTVPVEPLGPYVKRFPLYVLVRYQAFPIRIVPRSLRRAR